MSSLLAGFSGPKILELGQVAYRQAWDLQLQWHQRVLEAQEPAGVVLLLEHPPVVTFGRRPEAQKHLLVSPQWLQERQVELVETDRGGDITFHGPGQWVAYPILPLNTYQLNIHQYMRLLEEVVIATLADFGLQGLRSPGATGVWVRPSAGEPEAKVCALGVKLRRWVSLHGLALNVETDLSYFQLINPCGLGRPVTSLRKLMGQQAPSMPQVAESLKRQFGALATIRERVVEAL